MKKLTFSQKEIAQKTTALVLFRGRTPSGELMYAYVHVKMDNLIKFKEDSRKSSSILLQNYGDVIEWDYGNPTPEVMERMRDEYGFDHQSGIIIDDGPTAYEKEQAAKAAAGIADSED